MESDTKFLLLLTVFDSVMFALGLDDSRLTSVLVVLIIERRGAHFLIVVYEKI